MDEIVADVQQYYGLYYVDLVENCEFDRAYALVTQLGPGSRTMAAIDPAASWTVTDQLVAAASNNITMLRYERAGGKGRKPKLIEPPKGRAGVVQHTVKGKTREQVDALLSAPRI